MDLVAIARELPPVWIERERSEARGHDTLLRPELRAVKRKERIVIPRIPPEFHPNRPRPEAALNRTISR
jgi:hypothetical protein